MSGVLKAFGIWSLFCVCQESPAFPERAGRRVWSKCSIQETPASKEYIARSQRTPDDLRVLEQGVLSCGSETGPGKKPQS